jgi:phosphatidylethanolamine-binding protein (PEBP) family uncharacterized protein
MQSVFKVTPGAALLVALALSGCGSGSSSSATSFGTIALQSSALSTSANPAPVPARYTCDGRNIAPPLEWGAVPAGTKELAITLVELPAAAGGPAVFVPQWVIAGVNPALGKLAAGEVPPGARVGIGPNGKKRYSLCPKKGETKLYQFAVYSLRPTGTVAPTFNDNALLREIASGPSATSATAGGAIRVTYTRKK